MLRKYHKRLFFLTIVALFCVGCGFPYNTPEARKARQALRIQKQWAKRQAAETTPDTAIVAQPSGKGKVDIIAPKPDVVQGADSMPLSDPNRITLVADDSSGLDSLSRQLAYLDSIGRFTLDSLTALALSDSLELDSIAQAERMKAAIARQVRYSKDSIDQPVRYESADSMIYDLRERKVYLYHNAEVFYEKYSLKAGYIEFNFLTNIATATCLLDSAGNEVECPVFNDQTQEFVSRRIEFNFKTKKGKVYDASTQQGDGYLVSDATKFISGDVDTNSSQNLLYSQGCLYTTCNAKHPHFGIRASKAKIIPNKLIVVGPSYLEIMGSPTPIVLPFGFFPITKNKRSGLILSMDIDLSTQVGPGIRGMGFYLGMSEYWDLKVTGDFYMRGSLRARAESNYNIRYKGRGFVEVGYTRIQQDNIGTPDYSLSQEFNFKWNHRQEAQAHPSQNFSAKVDFGTSNFYSQTFNDASNVLAQNFNSNIGYNKRFLGTPFTLSLRASHSQNTETRIMTINLPQFGFNMNQIFPFKRKNISGKQRWYELIGFSYSASGDNRITTTDTALFKPGGLQEALQTMDYGMTHTPRVRMAFKIFKGINIEPHIAYSQRWFFYRTRQVLDTALVYSEENPGEVLSHGTVKEEREYGLFTTHDFRAGIGVNTRIFATGRLNMGPLRQLHAVISPSVDASWIPSYANARPYYYDSVATDARYPNQLREYAYFGYRPPREQAASLNYNLGMRIEAKVSRSRRDTTNDDPLKKVVLMPSITLRASHNLFADSNHLSPISFNAYTLLFKKLNLRVTSTFDLYAANPETNSKLADWEYDRTGRLFRVTRTSFNASTSITSRDLKAIFQGKDATKSAEYSGFDFLQSLTIQYNLGIDQRYIGGVDTALISVNQITFTGKLNLSKGWLVSVNRIGYDFKEKRITFPDFTFARDLHCWQMGLSWQPERQSWSFFIRTKPGSLDFLKVPVRREFYDVF